MPDGITDLRNARILVTNDDGIHAKGIQVLEEVARSLSDDVWVVAPELEQSGASHSLTLRHPLRMRQRDERRFSVDGTPTDSVLMAVGHLLKEHRPDLLLSGVNRGANLGEDVTYSGTVAAAMEGTLLGVPSIALSLCIDIASPARWDTARAVAPDLIRKIAASQMSPNILVNVNFPDLDPDDIRGTAVVPLGRRKLGEQLEERHDPRGTPYYWIGPMRDERPDELETDLGAISQGRVAVTPVHLDLTHRPDIPRLASALGLDP